MAERKLFQKDLAEIAGVTPPSVNEWKNEGAMPRADTAVKIADFFNVSTKWLITGINDADLSQDERDILEAYKRLNADGKKAALITIQGLEAAFPQLSEQAGVSTGTAI